MSDRVEPAVGDFELPAVRLSALTWGPADGPVVIALHGFPDTAWTWRHLGPHLGALGFRVIAPHLRGYAPSSLAADGSYHVGALMADAVALHSALGADDRAMLVGHDWGAITANALAGHADSPFRAVVSLAVPPIGALTGAPLRLTPRQVRMSWYTMFNQLPAVPERVFERYVRRLWRAWSPAYDATDDVRHVLESLAERRHRSAAVGYYRAFRSPWSQPREYRRWQSALSSMPKVPLLYVHGADDGCLQVGYAEHAATRMPDSARVEIVDGAGHFLQVERPSVVNNLISEFLSVRLP